MYLLFIHLSINVCYTSGLFPFWWHPCLILLDLCWMMALWEDFSLYQTELLGPPRILSTKKLGTTRKQKVFYLVGVLRTLSLGDVISGSPERLL